MIKLFSTVPLLSLVLISFHRVSATEDAKISNEKSQNEFLDNWKSPKDIFDKCPYYVSGFDVERRSIFVFELGKWPIRYFVEKGGKDLENFGSHIKQFFQRVELGPRAFFNESELGASDSVVIVDWAGFSLTQFLHAPTVQYILHHFAAFQTIQDSFAYGFYLNVNSVASHFIVLAKPVMGSAFERIEILGTKKSAWIPKLLRRINNDQLPPWYGGTPNDNFKPVAKGVQMV